LVNYKHHLIYNIIIQDVARNQLSGHNLGKPWDGKVQGSEDIAPVGVYVYYIRVKDLYGGRKEFRGTVFLVKKD
jgi:hypothetical protein